MVTTNHSLSREEVVWWYTPTLRKDRKEFRRYLEVGPQWYLPPNTDRGNVISASEWGNFGISSNRPGWGCWGTRPGKDHPVVNYRGLSPVGELPILLYTDGTWRLKKIQLLDIVNLFRIDKGWRFSRAYLNDRGNWDGGSLRGGFTGPDDPTLTTLDRVMWIENDPRTVELESIPETDDTVRVVRLIQATFQRFVVDETPTVPSLWQEEEQVMCGWNELFPEDGRELGILDRSIWHFGGLLRDTDWGEGIVFEHPETWRWRVPK